MSGAREFTREELELAASASTVAAFALTLLDRIEEAEEAIRFVYEQTDAPFPSIRPMAVATIYAPDTILPAVRRAVERKGER